MSKINSFFCEWCHRKNMEWKPGGPPLHSDEYWELEAKERAERAKAEADAAAADPFQVALSALLSKLFAVEALKRKPD